MTQTTIERIKEEDIGSEHDAEGFGCMRSERGPLPLKELKVAAQIEGLGVTTAVYQLFTNTHEVPLEITYIFPLPCRAAVSRLQFKIADRVIEGIIKERGEARAAYQQALDDGHRAAISEEERSGVFTMRAGNIKPGESVSVRLELVGPLTMEATECSFRFPLVVAPRYIPGRPLGGHDVGEGTASDTELVPDASRITPPVLIEGYPNPINLSLSVDINENELGVSNLRSSLHAVTTRATKPGWRRIELQPGERLNRDFILRFAVAQDTQQSRCVLTPDAESTESGTFALTIVPARASGPSKPRDVVFVLDRSGSMAGWKMVAARRAVGRMLDTLSANDRFGVLAFDNSIELPPEHGSSELRQADDRQRYRCLEWLSTLEARGGTAMAEPMERAARLLGGGYQDRDKFLVLVTDGQVGNEDNILRRLSKLIKNVRIFSVGIDKAVNEGFLRRLATLGAGATELVESEDRLDESMQRIHRRISTPVLTELALQAQGFEVEPQSIVPRRLPDLCEEAALVIRGRYRGPAEGSLQLKGVDRKGDVLTQSIAVLRGQSSSEHLLWARSQIRALEDEYAIGDSESVANSIIETSLRYNVLSRFTAFVAVDKSEVIGDVESRKGIVQPVESPEGWSLGFGKLEQASVPGQAAISASTSSVDSMSGDAGGFALSSQSAAMPKPAELEEARADKIIAGKDSEERDSREPRGLFGRKRKGKAAPARPAPAPMAPPPAMRAPRRSAPSSQAARREESVDLSSYASRLRSVVESASQVPQGEQRLLVELRALQEDLATVRAPSWLITALAEQRRLLVAACTPQEIEAVLQALTQLALRISDEGQSTSGRAFWR